MERLQFYEIHTKSLTIVYPRSVSFDTMYDDEFVPEMQAIDVPWKAREKGLQLCLLDGADTGLGAAETCSLTQPFLEHKDAILQMATGVMCTRSA